MAATPIVPVIPVNGWRVATPGGPSDSRSEGMPSRGIPGRYPAVNWFVDAASCAPSSSVSFSSSVISLISFATRGSPATRGARVWPVWLMRPARAAAAGANAALLDASAVAEPIHTRPVSIISAADIRAILPDTFPMAQLIDLRMAHLIRSPDQQPSSVTWLYHGRYAEKGHTPLASARKKL